MCDRVLGPQESATLRNESSQFNEGEYRDVSARHGVCPAVLVVSFAT